MIGFSKMIDYSSVRRPACFPYQAGQIGSNGSVFTVMKNFIVDEFTHLPISRQRKYQMRRQRDKRCTECGDPAARGSRCLKHLVKARERQRKKRGLKRRYVNTLSYKLQAGIL